MSLDKRKYTRFDTAIDGEFKVRDTQVGGTLMTDNFSRGGFRAMINQKVEKDAIVDVEMRFPQTIVPFFATGRVVWVKENPDQPQKISTGIQLVEIDPLERLNIMNYCYKVWSQTSKGDQKTEFDIFD